MTYGQGGQPPVDGFGRISPILVSIGLESM